jgi:hypothetical protein
LAVSGFYLFPMQRIILEFPLIDADLAEFIANAKTPTGIKTTGLPEGIKASDETGGYFISIAINFSVSIPVLASWLYKCCVKSGKKKGRVNGQNLTFNKCNITLVVQNELRDQNKRNPKRTNNKNRTANKRR